MSGVGWSCATLADGFQAVVAEDEAALQAQEEEILRQIQDFSLLSFSYVNVQLGSLVDPYDYPSSFLPQELQAQQARDAEASA